MKGSGATTRALLLALLGTWAIAPAQQPEPKGMGVWYIYFADYGVSEKWSVHHETHLHLYEPLQAFNRFVMRAGPSYRLTPSLTGTFLYHYSYSDPTFAEEIDVNRLDEHRLMEQLIYRHKYARWGFSHRLRTEQRFFDLEGIRSTSHRARYRLLLSHPLAGPVYGSGDGEVLAEWRDQASMSYRLSGSVGAFLNPRLRLQVGYTHFFLPGGRHDERIRVLLLYNTGAGHKTAEP